MGCGILGGGIVPNTEEKAAIIITDNVLNRIETKSRITDMHVHEARIE